MFTNRLEATDGSFLHLGVRVSFLTFEEEMPGQVYLLIKKQTKERNLAFTKYATKHSGDLMSIIFDFSKDMEHMNGLHDMELHVSDNSAENTIIWQLGTINVWFKEGLDSGDNLGIKAEFKPREEIWHIFPQV